MNSHATADVLFLYGQLFTSRLLLGTARYPSLYALEASIKAACPAMVTVAPRTLVCYERRRPPILVFWVL
ncbi:hypothetical protein [Candidatus Vallotia lariciata]|uniref:hypothetical protein n=1 Tax=Candidatus Vallotia laricis TaxID=2018052 RepID=UPI003B967E19